MAKTVRGLEGEIKRMRALSRKKEAELRKAKKLREVLLKERSHLGSVCRDLRDTCDGRSA